ncbi:uncharacterized protein LOC117563212 [Drosophila albomicans]|uniref:Uncharacterized protein LOC117563212 n=1 Tax=Drosophila albomicans TaxID=7291 RepID=A0A6P8W0Z5_DROAB|nr:uncharacterized protein LOC117563212 [Drosophila albomicans]
MQIASMKHTRCISNSQQQLLLLLLLISAACFVQPAAGRGGRGRGGGSFGGIFGGWRSKYGSKSSSSGGGRRVVSGSPVHTAMTVPKVPLPPPPPPPPKPMSMPKPQLGNYPRQQLPHGYNFGYGSAPSQGTYYANTQALPSGAIYYPQPPMGSSFGSGTNGFLTGFLAARLMHSMNRGHYHQVYHQNPNQNPQGGEPAQLESRRIIVINNGQQGEGVGEGQGQGQGETEAPLQEVQFFAPPLSNEEETQEELSSEEQTTQSTDATAPPVGGIVCFPIMMKETDPLNAEEVREVERIACVPAASLNAMANVDCQNDPQCMAEQVGSTTTSTEPPIVAGDIGSASDSTEEDEEGATAAEEVTEVTNSSQADVDAMLN